MATPTLFYFSRFSENAVRTLGWILWISCVVLISYYVYLDGARATIPEGQYVFFGLSILIVLILLPRTKNIVFTVSLKLFLILFIALFLYVFLSSIFGISHIQGARLSGIILLTVLSYVILGCIVSSSKLYQLLTPLFILALVSAMGAAILQWTGPLELDGVRIGNYLHHGSRWSFLFEEANGLAGILAVGITTLLYLAWIAENKIYTLLLVGLIMPFMLFVFWMTNSRASLAWLLWSFLIFFCLVGVYWRFHI